MADVVWSVLVVLAGAAAVLLGHRALRHWWAERAGRAYELPVDRGGTALRAAAAGAAALLAGVLALPLLGGGSGGSGGSGGPAPVVPVVQRSALNGADFGIPAGVPVTPVPRPQAPPPAQPPVQRRTAGQAATGAAAPAPGAEHRNHGTDPAELDELARRLLDPVARLLRTELRRGRDRIGRPHDGRR